MPDREQVNIGPYVQEFKVHGYSEDTPIPFADPSSFAALSHSEQAYATIKSPLHGIYTISTNSIAERARILGHHPEAIRRLKEAMPQVDRPFLLLAQGIKGYLTYVIQEHFQDWLQPGFVSPAGSVFEGYDDMLKKIAEQGNPIGKEVFVTLLQSAADAGVDYIRAICEVIPERFKKEGRKLDPVDMTLVAKGHYRTIREVAMSTNDLFINLFEDLSQVEDWEMQQVFYGVNFGSDTQFAVEKFHLQEIDGILHLGYDSKIYRFIQDPKSAPLPTTPWIGCPAAYGIGIAQIYGWFMEYAPEMYRK